MNRKTFRIGLEGIATDCRTSRVNRNLTPLNREEISTNSKTIHILQTIPLRSQKDRYGWNNDSYESPADLR
jgi:hypothetical protein